MSVCPSVCPFVSLSKTTYGAVELRYLWLYSNNYLRPAIIIINNLDISIAPGLWLKHFTNYNNST